MLKWRGGPQFNMVYDTDGSLLGSGSYTVVTPYYPHFD